MVEELLKSSMDALGNAFIMFLLPMILGAISCELKNRKEKKKLLKQIDIERQKVQYHIDCVNDMIENGKGGKVLAHLIRTGQL